MASLEALEDFIWQKVEKEHWTHSKLSAHLQEAYPGERGFSVRSLQRFCREKAIRKTARLSEQELDEAVAGAISKVIVLGLLYVVLNQGSARLERSKNVILPGANS